MPALTAHERSQTPHERESLDQRTDSLRLVTEDCTPLLLGGERAMSVRRSGRGHAAGKGQGLQPHPAE